MTRTKQQNNIIRTVLGCLIAAAALLLSFGTATARAEAPGRVSVAYFETEKFQTGNADGTPKSGYSYEILQEIANHTGWQYDYIYGAPDALYARFLAGEIDLFPGLTYREDRARRVDLSSVAMDTDYCALFLLRTDTSITGEASLNGKRIGLVPGTTATDRFVEWVAERKLHPVLIYYYGGDAEMLTDELENGYLDGFAAVENEVDPVNTVKLHTRYAETKAYLGVRKGASEILSEVNRALTEIETENPYFFSTVKAKYFDTVTMDAALTEAENDWVGKHPVLNVGFIDGYAPYSVTTNGHFTGLLKDVMEELLPVLRLEDRLKIRYVPYADYDAMLAGLAAGETDLIFPVVGNPWFTESAGVMPTASVFDMPMSAVYRGDYADALFTDIAVAGSRPVMQQYVREHYPNARIVTVGSDTECLRALTEGRADTFILSDARLSSFLTNTESYHVKHLPLESPAFCCFGVKRGNTALRLLLNRGIAQMDKTRTAKSLYYYVQETNAFSVERMLHERPDVVFGVCALILLLILLGAFIYIRMLRRTRRMEEDANAEMAEHYEILEVLSVDYMDVYLIDPVNDLSTVLKQHGQLLKKEERVARPYRKTWETFVQHVLAPADRAPMLAAVEIDHVLEQLDLAGEFTYDFESVVGGEHHNYRMRYLTVGEGNERAIILAFIQTDDIVEAERERLKELKAALVAAQEANKAKTVFLNSMSHDIRTPMNAILGFTRLMEKELDDPAKLSDHLEKVRTSGDYLLALMNNVLEFARIDSGRVTVNESLTDLLDGENTVLPYFEEDIRKKGLKFSAEMDITHRYVYVDMPKTKEITMNLLSNAIKYTPEGGSVAMRFTESPSDKEGYATYTCVVSDTGRGMSAEYLAHIFDMFTRERDTTESKVAGTGLGMAIVKKLVDMLNGTIEIDSAPGKGTTIAVTMEHRIAEAPEAEPDRGSEAHEADLSGKRILLAEDNDLNAEIAVAILSEMGLDAERAADGAACVAMLERHEAGHYDLILMDIRMPNMNGYEATRAIRALGDARKAHIPIVAMTANTFDEDRRDAFAAGMNAHIAKPIDVDVLRKTLTELLG
ncbi:MAG: transporter substrate-binding domain-containing protein [Clostridia bacterium]|nr:transporter substrate-binding domain-containing protein [Clostridia bacterium]